MAAAAAVDRGGSMALLSRSVRRDARWSATKRCQTARRSEITSSGWKWPAAPALVLPFLVSSSPSRFLSFSVFIIRFFCGHPDEGMAERRQAPGCSGTRLAYRDAAGRALCGVPCVPCDRDARLSALHRGDFGPGAALPSPALPPENAFSELLAAQVIVPGGRGPVPSEPAVTSRRRGTPLPAPPSGCL